MIPSGPEWIWIVVVVVLIFGASRLPLLGRNLGQGIKEFKKGVKEAGRDDSKQVAGGAKGAQATNAAEPATNSAEPSTPDRLADRRD
jgi:sec-independent protein translocase protein TatA